MPADTSLRSAQSWVTRDVDILMICSLQIPNHRTRNEIRKEVIAMAKKKAAAKKPAKKKAKK